MREECPLRRAFKAKLPSQIGWWSLLPIILTKENNCSQPIGGVEVIFALVCGRFSSIHFGWGGMHFMVAYFVPPPYLGMSTPRNDRRWSQGTREGKHADTQ